MYENIVLGFEFEIETKNISTTYRLIDELSLITGYTEHYVYDYHENKYATKHGKWRVEEDSSILGAEFISPPMPYIKAKEMVKEFFGVIKKSNNALITEDCGLHVGMSINGTVNKLNLPNFLGSLNYNLIASLWPKRIKNHKYVKNIGDQLLNIGYIKKVDIEKFTSSLFFSSHSFISLKEFDNKKYLELRVPGGKDYHHKFKELFMLIDHVANKMLSNSPITPATINKKSTKKITSYINRALERSQKGNWNSETIIKKLNSKIHVEDSQLERIVRSTISAIQYNTWENNDVHLYVLIKYCIIHRREFDNYLYNKTVEFLKLIKNLDLSISIPVNEPVLEKVKLFKHWRYLPKSLLLNLLLSIDSKHADKYLTKYAPSGIRQAVLLDSKGILKKRKNIPAYKHNKAN